MARSASWRLPIFGRSRITIMALDTCRRSSALRARAYMAAIHPSPVISPLLRNGAHIKWHPTRCSESLPTISLHSIIYSQHTSSLLYVISQSIIDLPWNSVTLWRTSKQTKKKTIKPTHMKCQLARNWKIFSFKYALEKVSRGVVEECPSSGLS